MSFNKSVENSVDNPVENSVENPVECFRENAEILEKTHGNFRGIFPGKPRVALRENFMEIPVGVSVEIAMPHCVQNCVQRPVTCFVKSQFPHYANGWLKLVPAM